jgi:hypothetical protein
MNLNGFFGWGAAMKKLRLSFVALGLALTVQTQPAAAQGLEIPNIPSPNRLRSTDLAAATEAAGNAYRRPRKVDQDPLVWVDSNGQAVGRFSSVDTMVIPFNGEQALVRRLLSNCTLASPCASAYHATWSNGYENWIWYLSRDCTGQAYTAATTSATPYVGTSVELGGTTYIYVFQLTRMSSEQPNSFLSLLGCTATGTAGPLLLSPAVAILPSSALGTEPYGVK